MPTPIGNVKEEDEEVDSMMVVIGRILMSVIFIVSGIGKITGFHGYVGMMNAKGIPLPAAALVVVIIIELVGGLMLLAGIEARWTAIVLFVYLIPISIVIHNFWAAPADQRVMQEVNFLKNVAIMGGLLAFAGRERR